MPIRGPGNVDGARRRRRRGAPTWSTLAPVFPLSLSHPLTPARGIKEKDIHRGGRSSPGQTATTLARRRSFARAESRVHRRVSQTITSRRESSVEYFAGSATRSSFLYTVLQRARNFIRALRAAWELTVEFRARGSACFFSFSSSSGSSLAGREGHEDR